MHVKMFAFGPPGRRCCSSMATLATALLVGVPRSVVGLMLSTVGVGYVAFKAQAAARLRRWHVLLAAAIVVALVPSLRQGTRSGLRGLATFVSNVVGLATGRLKVVDSYGQKTLVEVC